MMKPKLIIFVVFLFSLLPFTAQAATAGVADQWLDLTLHPVGIISLCLFVFAYIVVVSEEYTHLRKSKPVIFVAGIIWALIAYQYSTAGFNGAATVAFRHNLLEFAELFLFLLVAMTYVNAMDERQVFMALRSWLVHKRCSYRLLFWITGGLSFVLSPVIDNLTTALVMCAVVLAVGKDNS